MCDDFCNIFQLSRHTADTKRRRRQYCAATKDSFELMLSSLNDLFVKYSNIWFMQIASMKFVQTTNNKFVKMGDEMKKHEKNWNDGGMKAEDFFLFPLFFVTKLFFHVLYKCCRSSRRWEIEWRSKEEERKLKNVHTSEKLFLSKNFNWVCFFQLVVVAHVHWRAWFNTVSCKLRATKHSHKIRRHTQLHDNMQQWASEEIFYTISN